MTEQPKNTPRDFDVSHFENFAQIFAYNRQYTPKNKVFVQGQNRTLTYGQLDNLTSRLCGYFKEQQLSQGERAVIISRDSLAVTTLFMASLRYGLTAVILNPESGNKEHLNMIKAAKPRAFFIDETIGQDLGLKEKQPDTYLPITPLAPLKPPSILGKLTGVKLSADTYPGRIFNTPAAATLDNVPAPDDLTAYILFTSGTTSRPKGVEITHKNLLSQMKTFVRQYGYTPQSCLLNILPLHHTDGLTQGPVVAFTTGASVYRPLHFSLDKLPFLLDSIYAHHITHFIAVPSMLQLIDTMDEDADTAFQTDRFEFVISTAGYLDPNLWARFEERFKTKIVNVYGLTETVCESLYCGPDETTRKIGTIGKPVDTQTRIVDDNGQDVKQGEAGELWLKGDHIMKGYFEMPEETAAALTDDGWFKTGDLCTVDEDGFYHIVGRKKNIIIVGGINIYPEDVANILRGMNGVVDAAVWGETDPMWGEIVVAAVMPEQEAAIDTNHLGEQFLKEAAVEMMPRRIHVVEDFPRGPAGKVILRDLQEIIQSRHAQKAEDTGDSLEQKVLQIAAETFKTTADKLSLADTTDTVKGWNSLAHVELLLSLEKHFNITIGPREIMAVKTLADAHDIVKKARA